MAREFARWSPPGQAAGAAPPVGSLADISPEALAQLRAYLRSESPVTQSLGFLSFQLAAVGGAGGTTSQTSYADLDTTTGAADQKYAPYILTPSVGRWGFLFGGNIRASTAATVSGVALVQQATGVQSSGSGSSLTVTLAAAPTSGNTLILAFGAPSANTIKSVTSVGATWTKLLSSSTNRACSIWQGVIGSAPGSTITVAYNSTGRAAANVSEYTGVLTTLDTSRSNSGTAANPSTGSVTTTNANTLLLAAVARNATSSAPTGGFTALTEATTTSTFLDSAYQIATSAAAYSTTWTGSGGSGWDAELAALVTGGSQYAVGTASMALSYNGVTYDTLSSNPTDAASGTVDPNGSFGFVTIDITNGSLPIKSQFNVSSGSIIGSFDRLFLIGFKIGNLAA